MSVKYIKNDKILIYRMNDLAQNNKPTFVFKISSVSLEIAENMTRGENHYLRNAFVYLDGNEKRTSDCSYTFSVSSTIEKKNHSCHGGL